MEVEELSNTTKNISEPNKNFCEKSVETLTDDEPDEEDSENLYTFQSKNPEYPVTVPAYEKFDSKDLPQPEVYLFDNIKYTNFELGHYVNSLLGELVDSRIHYKNEIEKLASLRTAAHELFNELFADKKEEKSIECQCKCKRELKTKHEFTTTYFQPAKSIQMQKLLAMKIVHLTENLPLSAYKSYFSRLTLDKFFQDLTTTGFKDVEFPELVAVLEVLFNFYSITSNHKTPDPGLQMFIRSWTERYVCFLYRYVGTFLPDLDYYIAKLVIKVASVWSAYLFRVSPELESQDVDYLSHINNVLMMIVSSKMQEFEEFEDCVEICLDRFPWRRIAEKLEKSPERAQGFIHALTREVNVELLGSKQIVRKLCIIAIDLVKTVASFSSDLAVVNQLTVQLCTNITECFVKSDLLSPESIELIFEKLSLQSKTILILPQQDQIGLLSALSCLGTAQYTSHHIRIKCVIYLTDQLLLSSESTMTTSSSSKAEKISNDNNSIKSHCIQMISFIVSSKPSMFSFLLHRISTSYQNDPTQAFNTLATELTTNAILNWEASLDCFAILKKMLFSSDTQASNIASIILQKYNYVNLSTQMMHNIQLMFLEFEKEKNLPATFWMLQILLALPLEDHSLDPDTLEKFIPKTATFKSPGFELLSYFTSKCYESSDSFKSSGILILQNYINESSDQYNFLVCYLLQRSSRALADLDIGNVDTDAKLSEIIFSLIGNSEMPFYLKMFSTNNFNPSPGCKLLTKTALHVLEGSDNLLEFWCFAFFGLEILDGVPILQNANIAFALDKILNQCLEHSYERFENCVMNILSPMFTSVRENLQEEKKNSAVTKLQSVSSYFFGGDEKVKYSPVVSLVNNFVFLNQTHYLSLALLLLDCEYFRTDKIQSIWPNLLAVLAKNPVIELGEAIFSATETMNAKNESLTLKADEFKQVLPPVLCAKLLLLDEETPLFSLVACHLFKYFFDFRRAHKIAKKVGMRIFHDPLYQDTFLKLKQVFEQKSSENDFYNAVRLWLDEPQLMNEFNDSLPQQYNLKLLKSIPDIQPWFAQLDAVLIRSHIDELNLEKFAITKLTPVGVKKLIFDKTDSEDKLLAKLKDIRVEFSEPTPPSSYMAPGFSLPVNVTTNLEHALPAITLQLQELSLYADRINHLGQRVESLDESYISMIPSLYSNVNTTTTLSISCNSGPLANACAGPAILNIQHKEKRFNSAISQHVMTNRTQYRNLIQSTLQGTGSELGISETAVNVIWPKNEEPNEEAPPDYALPEYDSPAIISLQFGAIRDCLKPGSLADDIFEKILEARLQSRNLVTRHILLDFIEKITPLTSPSLLIQQIVDFVKIVKKNEKSESKSSRNLKLEDVSNLVSHFKPATSIKNSFLYRQVMHALEPSISDISENGTHTQNFVALTEIESQMFFSILSKFDLSESQAFENGMQDVIMALDQTHVAIKTCRFTMKKHLKKEKKKNPFVEETNIPNLNSCRILAGQLTAFYVQLFEHVEDEQILQTFFINLFNDGQPPSKQPGKFIVDWSDTWQLVLEGITKKFITRIASISIKTVRNILLATTHIVRTKLAEESKFTWNPASEIMQNFISSCLSRTNITDPKTVIDLLEPFIVGAELEVVKNEDSVFKDSVLEKYEQWLNFLVNSIYNVTDSEFEIAEIIRFYLKGLKNGSQNKYCQNILAAVLQQQSFMDHRNDEIILPENTIVFVRNISEFQDKNLQNSTIGVLLQIIMNFESQSSEFYKLEALIHLSSKNYIFTPSFSLSSWRTYLAQLEHQLFQNYSDLEKHYEGICEAVEKSFQLQAFIQTEEGLKRHDSFDFVPMQDDLALLVKRVLGFQNEYSREVSENLNIWKIRAKITNSLFNLFSKWSPTEVKNPTLQENILSLLPLGKTIDTIAEESIYQKYFSEQANFLAGLLCTKDSLKFKNDCLEKLLIASKTPENLIPCAGLMSPVETTCVHYHWIEQPSITKLFVIFYEKCLQEAYRNLYLVKKKTSELDEKEQIMRNYVMSLHTGLNPLTFTDYVYNQDSKMEEFFIRGSNFEIDRLLKSVCLTIINARLEQESESVSMDEKLTSINECLHEL